MARNAAAVPTTIEQGGASNTALTTSADAKALQVPRTPLIHNASQGDPGGVSGTNRVRKQRGGKRTKSSKLGL